MSTKGKAKSNTIKLRNGENTPPHLGITALSKACNIQIELKILPHLAYINK